ncbi:MAG: rod shape-determining protein MreC [Succinivibrio sp.]
MKNSDQNNSYIHMRFAIVLIMSLAVMAMDVRSKFLSDFRFYVESALYPILVLADSPHSVGRIVSTQFKSHSELIKENERLSNENFLQRADILRLHDLESENQALRQLLNSPVRADTKKLFAEVIDVDPDPYMHRVTVNRGSNSGVYEGMPVITDLGLVGQVMNVNYSFSRVLVLTDPNCAIPVIDERSSVRAIATGMGAHGEIVINNVPRSSDVQKGDLLLTSGIGGVYPRGYPVAVVSSVGLSESKPFADIRATPLVDTDKMRFVLMFWTNEGIYKKDAQDNSAKDLTDNKVVLHQNKVKELIRTLSVKDKNTSTADTDNNADKKKGGTNDQQ